MNTVFADKLNGIFTVFGCSNTEFEHVTGYNRSSLSRFRNGSRVPDVNSKSLYGLAEQIFPMPTAKICLMCSVLRATVRTSRAKRKQ